MSNRHKCTDYRAQISSYLDGDLTNEERDALLAHMSTCEGCRRTLEAYRMIGSELRSLRPVHPPRELSDSIFAQTIDSGPRRIYLFTAKVGYSVAAIAAIFLLFVVGIYLLVSGLQRSIDPEVIAAVPRNNVVWPLHKPIEITFNKAMNQGSVEAALSILPASELDRLNRDWNGNTLVIGQHQTLKPGSSYSVTIDRGALDKWGNPINEDFHVQFETSSTVALETPEGREPTPSATATSQSTASPNPTSTRQPPTSEPTQLTQAPPVQQSTQADQPTQPPAAPTEDPGSPGIPGGVTAEPTPLPPAATDEPPFIPPTATNTPTAAPTAAPTATSTERPTATPTQTATPTPLPTATATTPPVDVPAATATPDTIPVTGAFGAVYWGNPQAQQRLGDPIGYSAPTSALVLDFQHGSMILRWDTNSIYVIQSSGSWSYFPNVADSTPTFEPGPEPGTWIPGGPLGFLWQHEASLQSSLGYALEASSTSIESQTQNFQFGTMVYSRTGQIYLLYDAGDWELYSDPT